MTINKRMELIISALGLTNNSFSKAIAVNSTVIHNIIKGRNAPGYEVLQKIALSFDNIDMNWLITGEGTMFRNNEPGEFKTETKSDDLPCEKCRINEKLIESLDQQITILKKYIDMVETRQEQ